MKGFFLQSSRSLKIQLLAAMIIIIITLLSLLGVTNYCIAHKGILEVSTSYNQQLVEQICKNIELYCDEVMRQTDSLANQSSIKYYGDYFNTVPSKETKDDIKKVLFQTVVERSDIDDINIVHNDNNLVSMFGLYDEETLGTLCNYYGVKDMYLNARIIPIITTNKYGKPTLSIARSIYRPDEMQGSKYFIIVSLDINNINSILNSIYLGEGAGAFIVDAQGKSGNIKGHNKEVEQSILEQVKLHKSSKSINEIDTILGKKYLVSVNPLNQSGFRIVVYNPLNNLTKTSENIGRFSIFIVILGILVASALTLYITSKFMKPISQLVHHMSKISTGNLKTIDVKQKAIEMKILYEKFNEMILDLRELMKDIHEKNKLKRKAELYALQTQINPHFLYNTLDSINAMAALRGEKDIMQMTVALARLLRLSINTKREFVSIAEEIEHVKCYLKIQKIRYADKFEVIFDIQPSILNYKVVKLILQPLVENAIYHGIELKPTHGIITIRGYENEGSIYLEILDNGIGVNREKVNEIRQRLKEDILLGNCDSVGLYNVNSKIKLYYGEDYGLSFESEQEIGTTIKVMIPKMMEVV
ncbi:hypothetical protein CS063_12575 [Sporanaerobium hydrogeniformans]|uniref:Uncharacterized protein n=1 Tax=Sporanaerobium hydrogeniformans TaxID=3072179 RepID=A0AC61D9K2_9FIRM|nr:sensor histidine kinase [Sporanaerobium hydrogeniformans]PHV69976.1 hypothetical protein CS063_12575 [Sporanaerobium hydrogeniformans]